MTMILQLLVAAVAVGLTVAEPPKYKQNITAIQEATDILKLNILSMEGNIPFLNDSRRHYAEIIHVIHYQGLLNSGGVSENYYETYQEHLNLTASKAIDNPKIVIDEIKVLLAKVDNRTSELKEVIDVCIQDDDVCNTIIQDFVQENMDVYKSAASVLFAAGNAANELKKRNSKFAEVSKNLKAHSYVISSPQDLKGIVEAVIDLRVKLFKPL